MIRGRNKNLIIIIAVLLLTNIGVLAYSLNLGRESHKVKVSGEKERVGMTESLQKEVNFTEDQIALYKEMKEKQKQKIKPMFEELRKAKDSLFRLISYPEASDSLIDLKAEVIARKQKELDIEALKYFKRVRTVCNPDQLTSYDSLIVDVFRNMNKPSFRRGGDRDKGQKGK